MVSRENTRCSTVAFHCYERLNHHRVRHAKNDTPEPRSVVQNQPKCGSGSAQSVCSKRLFCRPACGNGASPLGNRRQGVMF